MADLPIIFSAPMIRALLDGRKTMMRRLPKSQPERVIGGDGKELPIGLIHIDAEARPRVTIGRVITRQEIRYSVGDRLWVRETIACGACAPGRPSHWAPSFWRREQGTPSNPNGIWYAADGLSPERTITDRGRWRPAIHMPRWCSRITLIVTAVKIERLQDISEEDAIAEGAFKRHDGYWTIDGELAAAGWDRPARYAFRMLWSSLHGNASWDANPYVVALTFSVHRCNIDALGKEAA